MTDPSRCLLSELYSKKMEENYADLHNRSKLEKANASYTEENEMCGDVLTVYLLIEGGVVRDAKFEGDGCLVSMACANITVDRIRNIPVSKILETKNTDISEFLDVRIAPSRVLCANLALRAAKKAITIRGGCDGNKPV